MKTNKFALTILLLLLSLQLPLEKASRVVHGLQADSVQIGHSSLGSTKAISIFDLDPTDTSSTTSSYDDSGCRNRGTKAKFCKLKVSKEKAYKTDKKKKKKLKKSGKYEITIESLGKKKETSLRQSQTTKKSFLRDFDGTRETDNSGNVEAISVKVSYRSMVNGKLVYCEACGREISYDLLGTLSDSNEILRLAEEKAKEVLAAEFDAEDEKVKDQKNKKLAKKKYRLCKKDLDDDEMEKDWDSKEEQRDCYQANLVDDELDLTDKEKKYLWARLAKNLRKGLKSKDWDKVETARATLESLSDADLSYKITQSLDNMTRVGEYRDLLNEGAESIDSMGGTRNPWTYQTQQQLAYYQGSLGRSFQGREGRHWKNYLDGQFRSAIRSPGRYLRQNGIDTDGDLFGDDSRDRDFLGGSSLYGDLDYLDGSSYRDQLSYLDRGYSDDFLLDPLASRRRDRYADDYLLDDYSDDPLSLRRRSSRSSLFSNGLYGRLQNRGQVGSLGRSRLNRNPLSRRSRFDSYESGLNLRNRRSSLSGGRSRLNRSRRRRSLSSGAAL